MKKLVAIFMAMGAALLFATSAFAQADQNQAAITEKQAAKVQVYYFHGDRRCETCKAVGKVSKDLVDSQYGDNKNVEFVEVNYDEKGNEALVEKFEVTSSGLYVYNQEKVVNLTTYAFQYAKTDPAKLETKLKNQIDKNLK
jgi:hypothetical protein